MTEWTEDGKPMSWVTESESEWTEMERDLVFALMEDEADRCPGCGEPLHESTDAEVDPDNPYGTARYVASHPLVCFSCEVKDKAEKKLRKISYMKNRRIFLATKRVMRKPLIRR